MRAYLYSRLSDCEIKQFLCLFLKISPKNTFFSKEYQEVFYNFNRRLSSLRAMNFLVTFLVIDNTGCYKTTRLAEKWLNCDNYKLQASGC